MKNIYASTLLVFLLLCGLTATAQTHRQALRTVKGIQPLPTAQQQRMMPAAPTQPQRIETGTEDMEQPNNWLTNLYVAYPIFEQNFNPVHAGYWFGFSTVYSSELVEYFKGDRITTIKTIIPEGPIDSLYYYVVDADTPTDTLYAAGYSVDIERAKVVDLPCDAKISRAMNIRVGFNMHFCETATELMKVPIVVCNRYSAWLVWDEENNTEGFFDYTHMRYSQYRDPNLCYGYFFHCVTEGENHLPDYEFKPQDVSYARAFLGEYGGFSAAFTNYGVRTVNNIKVRCTMGDQTAMAESNEPIEFLGYRAVKSGFPAPETPVRLPLTAEIVEVDGVPVSNAGKMESSIVAVDKNESPARTVVMEEFTGTWCGWCPRGMRAIELLSEKYGEGFIPIAIHSGDDFYCADFQYILNNYGSAGFPGCALNRADFGVDPFNGSGYWTMYDFGVQGNVMQMQQRPTEAIINIDKLDWDGKNFTIETTSTFTIDCATSPYSLTYVITEDGQKAVQTNYYPITYGSTPEKVSEYLRDFCSMGQYAVMDMNHIGRGLYGVPWLEGVFSGKIERGKAYKHTYTLPMPASVVNPKKVNVIAMLIDTESEEIVNAVQMSAADVVAVHAVDAGSNKVEAIDGGLRVQAQQGQMEVYSLDGRLVRRANVAGTAYVSLPAGTYVVKVATQQGTSSHKAIVR